MMKNRIFLLLTIILIIAMLAGCRKQTTGQPGDPTVNNSTNTENTRETVIPSMTTRPTDATRNTTIPFNSDEPNEGTMSSNVIPEESTLNSDARNRNRAIPHS